ncbi:TPA: hypothetical protein ACH3X3_004912 [Trebouxia sp. C0006]
MRRQLMSTQRVHDRRPTSAEQPLTGGSHANVDDLGAAALEAVSCGGSGCGDSEELAGLNGDIDMEQNAVDTTPEA